MGPRSPGPRYTVDLARCAAVRMRPCTFVPARYDEGRATPATRPRGPPRRPRPATRQVRRSLGGDAFEDRLRGGEHRVFERCVRQDLVEAERGVLAREVHERVQGLQRPVRGETGQQDPVQLGDVRPSAAQASPSRASWFRIASSDSSGIPVRHRPRSPAVTQARPWRAATRSARAPVAATAKGTRGRRTRRAASDAECLGLSGRLTATGQLVPLDLPGPRHLCAYVLMFPAPRMSTRTDPRAPALPEAWSVRGRSCSRGNT